MKVEICAECHEDDTAENESPGDSGVAFVGRGKPRAVCGRLKSDYRYSNKLVYNNFPWPDATEEQQEKIAELAQGVLDARAQYPDSSLADLYDPLTMPPELVAAHRKLDAAVEKAYGHRFADEAERVAYLFERYRALSLNA